MDGFEELDRMFSDMLREFPNKKRELMEKVGEKMQQQVISNIEANVGGDGEEKQKLKDDVEKVIGSKGGYTAVRPSYKNTNLNHLIENGHNIVRNGTIIGWANGKHMYRDALEQVSEEAIQMAEDMINEVVRDANG